MGFEQFGREIPNVFSTMTDVFVSVLLAHHLLGVKGTMQGTIKSNGYLIF